MDGALPGSANIVLFGSEPSEYMSAELAFVGFLLVSNLVFQMEWISKCHFEAKALVTRFAPPTSVFELSSAWRYARYQVQKLLGDGTFGRARVPQVSGLAVQEVGDMTTNEAMNWFVDLQRSFSLTLAT